jgi:hypothetical protein
MLSLEIACSTGSQTVTRGRTINLAITKVKVISGRELWSRRQVDQPDLPKRKQRLLSVDGVLGFQRKLSVSVIQHVVKRDVTTACSEGKGKEGTLLRCTEIRVMIRIPS